MHNDVICTRVRKVRRSVLKRVFWLTISLFLVESLLVASTHAAISFNVQVGSSGTILYSPTPSSTPAPTPNPSPSPSSPNLAPIVAPAINNMVGGYWSLCFGDLQYAFLDESVTHNGHPSIRLEPDPNNYREVDGTILSVKPGDHIVASVWIKTDPSSLGDTDVRDGGRFGMDMYARTSAGYGQVDWHPTNEETWTFAVPWGTTVWTQKSWDIIVPSGYYTTVYTDEHYMSCDPVQIDSFVLWLDAREYNDQGCAWFADSELYINP